MNNADRRKIANCFDRLLHMTYPASGVEVRPAALRSAIRQERKLAMEIMGCDCGLASEPREGGTVEVIVDPNSSVEVGVKVVVDPNASVEVTLPTAAPGLMFIKDLGDEDGTD